MIIVRVPITSSYGLRASVSSALISLPRWRVKRLAPSDNGVSARCNIVMSNRMAGSSGYITTSPPVIERAVISSAIVTPAPDAANAFAMW